MGEWISPASTPDFLKDATDDLVSYLTDAGHTSSTSSAYKLRDYLAALPAGTIRRGWVRDEYPGVVPLVLVHSYGFVVDPEESATSRVEIRTRFRIWADGNDRTGGATPTNAADKAMSIAQAVAGLVELAPSTSIGGWDDSRLTSNETPGVASSDLALLEDDPSTAFVELTVSWAYVESV